MPGTDDADTGGYDKKIKAQEDAEQAGAEQKIAELSGNAELHENATRDQAAAEHRATDSDH